MKRTTTLDYKENQKGLFETAEVLRNGALRV